MKKIEANINPRQLTEVLDILSRHGVETVTVSDMMRCDTRQRRQGYYRGTPYSLNVPSLDEMKVELVIDEPKAPALLQALREIVASDGVKDGRIWVSFVDDATESRPSMRRAMAG